MLRGFRALVMLGACLSLLFVGRGSADPAHTPGGPCIQDSQHVSTSSVANYDETVRTLDQIERSSQGLVTVGSAGHSGEGRELLYATVGTGADVFWLQARIHGNELQGTQAALDLLKWLASGNPDARMIRDNLTVVVVPLYNPDGAEANIRQSTTPTRIDLNRDWENFAQPESNAFYALWESVRPKMALDLHHMSSAPRVEGTDDLNQFQIGARSISPTRMTDQQWLTNRQMASVSLEALDGFGQTHTARYPDIDITNAVISRMLLGGPGPDGSDPGFQTQGAVFYEVRSVGQKSNGYLTSLFTRPAQAVLTAAGDGSLYSHGVTTWEQEPYAERGSCGDI
ncbi:MAG: M14 family zinc carboxypeptidase [Actinomycetota bacterium]